MRGKLASQEFRSVEHHYLLKMNNLLLNRKNLVVLVSFVFIVIIGIAIINKPSEFLENSDSGGYAIVFHISKNTSKANEFNIRLRDLGAVGMVSTKKYYIFSEDTNYIFSRIDRYSDSKIDSSEILFMIDNIISELKISDYVEYAVIYENGLAQSSSGFNTHLFP